MFIYKCKYSNVTPFLIVFKANSKATYKLELFIAKRVIITKSGTP